MSGLRSLSTLAIAAALLGACTGAVASPSAATPTAGDTPAPTRPAQPTVALTPVPTTDLFEPPSDLCPALEPWVDPEAELLNGDLVRVSITVTSIAPIDRPDEVTTPPGGAPHSSRAYFLGGRDAELSVYNFAWGLSLPSTITSMAVTLTLEGQAPVALPVRFIAADAGWRNAVIQPPDVDGRGTIDVAIEWRNACFVEAGTGSAPVRIQRAAAIADCPTGYAEGFDELQAAFDAPIAVDAADVDLESWYPIGKVANLASEDPLPPYLAFDATTPTLKVMPSSSIAIAEHPIVDLAPSAGRGVAFYERDKLLHWIEGGWIHGDAPEAKVIATSKLLTTGGGFGFDAPADLGRYAAFAAFDYDATCSFGTAGFVVGVDVVRS